MAGTHDIDMIKEAIELARQCPVSSTAFCVGSMIQVNQETVASGYSREYRGNTHAEEVALMKWLQIDEAREGQEDDARLDMALSQGTLPKVKGTLTLYTTMEPCAVRLSGKSTCAKRMEALQKSLERSQPKAQLRVVVGGVEPDDLVKGAQGSGTHYLREKGLEVVVVENEAVVASCLQVGRRDQVGGL